MALVDTSVWSLALRRARGPHANEATELGMLVQEGRAGIIGPVRQELLSGIRSRLQFDLLKEHLRGFPDLNIGTDDYELAAEYFNACRARGLQGSNTDFLICAVATRRGQAIFTTDLDFSSFARVIPIVLHLPRT